VKEEEKRIWCSRAGGVKKKCKGKTSGKEKQLVGAKGEEKTNGKVPVRRGGKKKKQKGGGDIKSISEGLPDKQRTLVGGRE